LNRQAVGWENRSDQASVAHERFDQFLRADSLKLNELRGKLQAVSNLRTKKLSDVEALESETDDLRCNLEATMLEMKSRHVARGRLARELENRMQELRNADMELERISTEFIDTKTRIRAQEEHLRAHERQLASIQEQKARYTKEIASADKELTSLRVALSETHEHLERSQHSLSMYRIEQKQKENHVRSSRDQLDALIKETEIANSRLNNLLYQLSQETARQNRVSEGKQSQEKEMGDAKQLLDELSSQLGETETHYRLLNDDLLNETSLLKAIEEDMKHVSVDTNNARLEITHVSDRLGTLAQSEDRVKERLVELEFDLERERFKLQSLEGRVLDSDERERLITKLKEVETQQREIKEVYKLVLNESGKQDMELKAVLQRQEEVNTGISRAEERQIELELQIEAIGRELLSLSNERDQVLMARDELSAHVASKKEELRALVQSFIELQQKHSEAESESETRKISIIGECQKLQEINKQLHDEKHALAIKVGELKSKVSQLRTKYDHLIRQRVGTGDDDIHSQAHAVKQASQERQTLLDQADRLAKELEESQEELITVEAAARSIEGPPHSDPVMEFEQFKSDFKRHVRSLPLEEGREARRFFVARNIENLKSLFNQPWFTNN
jgi:chromosome segregation ATPase